MVHVINSTNIANALQVEMAQEKTPSQPCPPPSRRHSIAAGIQSPAWPPGRQRNPNQRRGSIPKSLSNLTRSLSGLSLGQRRDSKGSFKDLVDAGVRIDNGFVQRVLCAHFEDETIKVGLWLGIGTYTYYEKE